MAWVLPTVVSAASPLLPYLHPARSVFECAFPMFVPSLSWQNDRFYVEMAQKDGVFLPAPSGSVRRPSAPCEKRKHPLSGQLFLRLSRACLGKLIVLGANLARKKGFVFRSDHSSPAFIPPRGGIPPPSGQYSE
jgi:hypothetical protein